MVLRLLLLLHQSIHVHCAYVRKLDNADADELGKVAILF